jgi:hypothetical protein
VNEEIKKFTYRFDSFFNGMLVTALLVCVFAWACDNFYIGKSQEEIEEELMQSMFEVDSLIGNIKIILGDSSAIERK